MGAQRAENEKSLSAEQFTVWLRKIHEYAGFMP
jgi:hypothetical protein